MYSEPMDSASDLHEQRLDAVVSVLTESAATTVLDLGCGPGFLLARLAGMTRFTKIVGLDIDDAALLLAERRLGSALEHSGGKILPQIRLVNGSFTSSDPALEGFDAAVMVETIEHIDPDRLSLVETAVFGNLRPRMVVITTPNQDFNELLGVPAHRRRHPDHRFEWPRHKFESWCGGAAGRNNYDVTFKPVGGAHPVMGGPTQMAIFTVMG